MIFENRHDFRYKKWFAWYPIFLSGPDEWNRCESLGCDERCVWLRFVWRYRTRPGAYYALPGPHTKNKLLLDSIEGRETDVEKRMREPL
jgi:hypothetical protein